VNTRVAKNNDEIKKQASAVNTAVDRSTRSLVVSFSPFFFMAVGLIYLFIYFSILLLLLLIRPLSSFTSFFVSVSNSSIITVLVVVRRQKVDAVDCENSNNATRQHGKDDGRSRGDCLKTA
jgi:hypothetical protein